MSSDVLVHLDQKINNNKNVSLCVDCLAVLSSKTKLLQTETYYLGNKVTIHTAKKTSLLSSVRCTRFLPSGVGLLYRSDRTWPKRNKRRFLPYFVYDAFTHTHTHTHTHNTILKDVLTQIVHRQWATTMSACKNRSTNERF